jgi:ABC-type Fe3+-hydroxamate transport system substrate-binding protein
MCGATNIFADLKTQGPAVDVEAIIARTPQAIVAVAPPGTANDWLAEWKRFGTLAAVKNGALIPFEDTRLSRFARPPRAAGARW